MLLRSGLIFCTDQRGSHVSLAIYVRHVAEQLLGEINHEQDHSYRRCYRHHRQHLGRFCRPLLAVLNPTLLPKQEVGSPKPASCLLFQKKVYGFALSHLSLS
jgi:hypothetical protein